MALETPLASDLNLPSDSVFVNLPCRAHVIVVDVDEDGMRIGGKNNKGEMVIELEVLAASSPSQETLHHKMYFTKSTAAAWRIHRAAVALGLITSEELKKMQEEGKHPTYDFEPGAIGKQMFVEIVNSEYDGKKTVKVEGGMFHLSSRQCMDQDHWPRHEAFIKKSGVVMPEVKKRETSTSTSGTSTASATKATSSPQGDKKPAGALAGLNLG